MTKAALIEALCKKENLTGKEASDVVNLIFGGFTEALKQGGRIEVRGFGTFVVRNYKAYTGRNPKTGVNIKVAPKRSAFFKAGKELKKMVDGKL